MLDRAARAGRQGGAARHRAGRDRGRAAYHRGDAHCRSARPPGGAAAGTLAGRSRRFRGGAAAVAPVRRRRGLCRGRADRRYGFPAFSSALRRRRRGRRAVLRHQPAARAAAAGQRGQPSGGAHGAGAAAGADHRRWCWRRPATAAPWRASTIDTAGRCHRPVRPGSCCRRKCATSWRAWCWKGRPPPDRCSCWTSAGAAGRSVWSPATQAAANTPFSGPLYFLNRALQPYTELREGSIETLLQRKLSVLILADDPLPAGPERDAVTKWVEQGGLLIRFAGPRTAQQPIGETDPLMPVRLLGGDRAAGRRDVLEQAGRPGAVPAQLAVCRAGGAG